MECKYQDRIEIMSSQLDLLNSKVMNIETKQQQIKDDVKLTVDNSAQIKTILENNRDREAIKRYAKVLLAIGGFVLLGLNIFGKLKWW